LLISSPVADQTECRQLCIDTPGCEFYTYYAVSDFCSTFRTCEYDYDCDGCVSGPKFCDGEQQPTPTTPGDGGDRICEEPQPCATGNQIDAQPTASSVECRNVRASKNDSLT